MYVIVKGCPRIPDQDIINIVQDRLAYLVDFDYEGDLREDGSCEGSRIAAIWDHAYENDIADGGTVDYSAMAIGACGVGRFGGSGFSLEQEKTVIQAAEDLRKYLVNKGYTGWSISEVYN